MEWAVDIVLDFVGAYLGSGVGLCFLRIRNTVRMRGEGEWVRWMEWMERMGLETLGTAWRGGLILE